MPPPPFQDPRPARRRSSSGTLRAVLGTALFTAITPPLSGQQIVGPVLDGGRIRLSLSPVFTSWTDRFGTRAGTGGTADETEPLGFDLSDETGARLFPGISDLEESVRTLIGDPSYRAVLGKSAATVSASRTRVPFGLDVGVTDWLTVGATVPIVKNRTEVAFAFRADEGVANLGVSPAISRSVDLVSFTDQFQAGVSAAEARASEVCTAAPSSPECSAAQSLAEEGASFLGGLMSAFASSPFFPLADSPAGQSLSQRFEAFNEALTTQGLAPVPPPLFATARVTQDEFQELLSDGAVGINTAPLQDRLGNWQLGDVELHAAVRLLSGVGSDSAGGGLRYDLGAGILVRLGTGVEDDPDVFFDLPAGDGQTDVQGRLFANVQRDRLGLWLDVGYAVQGGRTLIRRVAPPDLVLAPQINRTLVRWEPGGRLYFDVAPRYHLADALAFTFSYRLQRKAGDAYSRVSELPDLEDTSPLPSPPFFAEVSLLEAETEQTLHEVGGGIVFSTASALRGGVTSLPIEVRFGLGWGVAGSGGQTPKGLRASLDLSLSPRLWGGGRGSGPG